MIQNDRPLKYAGPSLLEMVWEKLDEETRKIMEDESTERVLGRAFAFAEVIAIFTNPYNPDAKAIRAEAKRRYQEGQEE